MKNLFYILFAAVFILSCSEKDNLTEADKLPPATQIGADTVGCLLDGKAFLPGYSGNSTQCFYQYVNGEYYFSVSFKNKDSNFNLTALAVGCSKLQIHQGDTYNLVEFSDHNANGSYTYNENYNFTSHTHTGELKITKLDPVNGIVCGTFWYDVEDKDGVVHQIREGRFDMHYTN